MLLSSHLLDRVQSVCDRVALFNDGKIALMGTVVELANQVLGGGHRPRVEAERRRRRRRACAASRACSGRAPMARRAAGRGRSRRPRRVARRIVAAGGALHALADLQPSLDEVYTRYFEEARHAA